MGMNKKINEHKNIDLEQNNNIINKIDEQEHHEQDQWTQIGVRPLRIGFGLVLVYTDWFSR